MICLLRANKYFSTDTSIEISRRAFHNLLGWNYFSMSKFNAEVAIYYYRKVSNIRRTKSQDLNASRLIL